MGMFYTRRCHSKRVIFKSRTHTSGHFYIGAPPPPPRDSSTHPDVAAAVSLEQLEKKCFVEYYVKAKDIFVMGDYNMGFLYTRDTHVKNCWKSCEYFKAYFHFLPLSLIFFAT